MARFRGTVRRNDVEGGGWELHADDGEHYQLRGGDESLRQEGARVEVDGKIDRTAFGIGMTGPTLAIKSFRRI